MPIENAVSGPVGNAGEADGLRAAFDAAAEKLDFGDVSFAPGAMDPPVVTEQPDDKTAPEDAAPVETEGREETAEEKAQRQRDEKGRFAKGKEDADKAAAKPAPNTEAMSPPAHWDAATRDAFGKLPAEAQRILLDRSKHLEAGFTRKSQELAEEKRFADSIRNLITDGHKEQLRRANMSEADGVSYLLKLNDAATKNPAGYVRWVAQQAKLDPRTVFPELSGGQAGSEAQQGEQPALDPRFQQVLQAHTQPLRQELDAIKRANEAAARQQFETKVSSAGETIAKFRSATDEAGNPKHPHFDQVRDTVQELVASHPSIKNIPDMGERLARAYKLAVLADPELETQVVDSEVQRREAERRRQEDLAKARRAAPVVRGSGNPVAASAKPKSREDALRSAMSKLGMS